MARLYGDESVAPARALGYLADAGATVGPHPCPAGRAMGSIATMPLASRTCPKWTMTMTMTMRPRGRAEHFATWPIAWAL